MNTKWGWNKHDKNFKSTEDLVRKLVDIASKGGNFLLNIGPKPDGTFPQESIDRLAAIGDWMDVNGESIYGTTASPTKRPTWGRITTKASGDTTTLYLHVFDWPKDGKLRVMVDNEPIACMLLADKSRKFKTTRDGENGIMVELAGAAPNAISSTVEIVYRVTPDERGVLTLLAQEATLNSGHGSPPQLEEKDAGKPTIGFWVDPKAAVAWPINISQPGEYAVIARVASEAPSRFTVTAGEEKLGGSIQATGSYESFKDVSLGRLKLDAGASQVTITPHATAWSPINLRSLVLKPVE